MAFELALEAESGLRLAGLRSAAVAAGAVPMGQTDEAGWIFPSSGLTVSQVPSGHRHVLTEGLLPLHWPVGLRAALGYDLDRIEACHRDVVAFLQALQQSSAARFVLSFEYETPYAVRDEQGLHWMPGTGLEA